jgi:uncharacterized membrane protein
MTVTGRTDYWQGRPPAETRAERVVTRRASRYPQVPHVVGLAAIVILTPAHALWAAQLLLVPLLLIFPGLMLLRALSVPGRAIEANCVYVPAASILVLTGSGLAIDLIGPLAGISAPLRTVPLLATLVVVCLILIAIGWDAPPEAEISWDAFRRPLALAWPLLLPLAGAAGALRLNSGHGSLIAVLALFAVIVTLVAIFVRAPWYEDSFLIVVIFAASLALMWSFSLRGDLVYGFDISDEYYALMQTVTPGIWHLPHSGDAYGAMLSVTLLPAELHALSGVPALFIFKVVYPVAGAFFPVGVFCLARRMLACRWAFVAACLVIMQQTFFQQFTALTRQEIATVLFVVLIAAVFDGEMPRRVQWAFACLLSIGVVVSHYSTAYLAIPLLGMAAALQFGVSWFKPVPRVSGVILLAFVTSLAGAVLWYGPITHSASNLSNFIHQTEGQGLNLLPTRGGSLLSAYLQGGQNRVLSPAQYQSYIQAYYHKHYPFITPLPSASQPQYDLQSAASDAPPVKSQIVSSSLSFLDLLVQQLTNLLAGVGSLILVLRRRQRLAVTQVGIFGLAGMLILILARLSGTVAQEYSPERAFLQLLTVLGIVIAWFFQWFGGKYKRSRPYVLAGCATALGLYMVGTTGFSAALLGGGTQSNLANNGTDYQRFVVNPQDLAAANWVSETVAPGQVLEADVYGGLRLDTFVGYRYLTFADMSPETTDAHAWVYATSANLADNVVSVNNAGTAASYAFPSLFFNSSFNVVYSDGASEVFHR